MSAFSDYMEGVIIDHFLRNTAVASPAAVYLALYESNPGEDNSGTETAYTGYARQASSWAAANAAGQTSNVAPLAFPANGSASVDITHGALFDAPTGGNMLLYGPLGATKTIANSDVLSFEAGSMNLTLA